MARWLVDFVRPGWSQRRWRAHRAIALLVRTLIAAFAFHLSGAAHLLADVLLDDDMTCVDELAHKLHNDSTAPRCPTASGVGHGERVEPPGPSLTSIAPATEHVLAWFPDDDAEPAWLPPRMLDRPPRV